MSVAQVEVLRGGVVESTHVVDVAVVAGDRTVAAAGDTRRTFFARSAVKPFQAMPLVEDGVLERYGLGSEALALACASHSSEDVHVAVARRMLDAIGRGEDDLACGPHTPFNDEAAEALRARSERPGRIHNNCSGKHAGMLALAEAHGWSPDGYHREGHPVQDRMLDEIARWTGEDRAGMATGVDGCGVVTAAFPLEGLARGFSRLADGARTGEDGPRQVVEAMTGHPLLVGGSDRLCTALMRRGAGRLIAKVGAEGVYGAAALDHGWGIALKARDGAKRAAEVALVGVLEALELLDSEDVEALAAWGRPEIRNTRDEVVGALRPVIELEIAEPDRTDGGARG